MNFVYFLSFCTFSTLYTVKLNVKKVKIPLFLEIFSYFLSCKKNMLHVDIKL